MSDRRYSIAFHLRSEVEGGYRYERVDLKTPDSGWLELDDVPAVGDSWWVGTNVKIVERQFTPSSWGSVNWPYGAPHQETPIMVDLICIESPGAFVDEVSTPDED